jgi:acyl dehydratase
MLLVDTAAQLEESLGQVLGVSGWETVTEADILRFAHTTHDQHWIHTDPARVARDTEYDGLLAHGFLLLSLVTHLTHQCFDVRNAARWINYGLDRVRFIVPVVAGDKIRLRLKLDSFETNAGTSRLGLGCELEREGSDKPAMAATWLVMVLEEKNSEQ